MKLTNRQIDHITGRITEACNAALQAAIETPEPGRPLKPVEDPMTCELRVGDTVEVVLQGADGFGRQFKIARVPKHGAEGWHLESYRWLIGRRSSLKLIARAGTPVQATPVEPLKPIKPKEEFSDKGIMPSDHPGINEMLKKGFKEIFGGELQPAPAKRTLPSNKALFIVASEKYLGLGVNDGLE